MKPLHAWDYNAKTETFMTAIGQCIVSVWQGPPDCWSGRIDSGRRQIVRSDFASFAHLETWIDEYTKHMNETDRRQRER